MTTLPVTVTSHAQPRLRVLPARRASDRQAPLTVTINPFLYAPGSICLDPARLGLTQGEVAREMQLLMRGSASQPGLLGFGALRIPLTSSATYRVLQALQG